jgi:hypothetical protein
MSVNADLSYPVVIFWGGSNDDEAFAIASDASSFDTARRAELGQGTCPKRLIDNDGRSWSVREVVDRGRSTPLWQAALMTMLFQARDIGHRAEFVLESKGHTPFADVQDNIIRLMEADPEAWVDVHLLDGDEVTETSLLAPFRAAIMGAADVNGLVAGLERLSPH